MRILSESVWRERLAQHQARLTPFVNDRLDRMARGEKHPVRDFLFEYYAYRPAYLLRWSPGVDVLLENAKPGDLDWKEFEASPAGLILPATSFPDRRRLFAQWALDYLEGIASRPALYSCFGLHEWAMVYRTPEIRHTRTPLRLQPETIAATVEAEDLCCTHFDAFRFFTPAAAPRNRHQLNRDATNRFDQRGCIHVTMDLYRYAHKISPWVSGELIADAFELAWKARELDMRASPYDLTDYGLKPICIETIAGKEVYVARQRLLAEEATPIRDRLIGEYRKLIAATTSATPNTPTTLPPVPPSGHAANDPASAISSTESATPHS
jgi:hypothetical protein